MQFKEIKPIVNLKVLIGVIFITIMFVHIMLIAGSGMVEAKEIKKISKRKDLRSKAIKKKYTGHKISLDFKDVNIREVFVILQAISGKKIIVAKSVTGRVTLSVKNMPWDQVLAQIVSIHGLKRVDKENSILITISKKKDLKKEKQGVKKKKKGLKKKKKSPDHVKATKVKQKNKYFQHKSFSEKRRFYAGLFYEYIFQGLDDQQTKDKFVSDVEIDFQNSSGFQLRGGYTYNDYFSFEGVFEYLAPFKAGIDEGAENSLDVMNISMNLKGTLPIHKRFRPYALLGTGVLNAFEDIRYNNETSKTSDWGPVYRGSIGLDMVIFINFSTVVELGYALGSGNVSHIRYATLGFGCVYHFK